MIPARVELPGFDAAFFDVLPLEEVECQPAEGRQFFGCMTGTGSAVVFPKANIRDPGQLVLHPPMTPNRLGKGSCPALEIPA